MFGKNRTEQDLREELGDVERMLKAYDQVPGKQTLESLNPGLLGSFLPTNWEKNQKKSPRMVSVRPRGFPSYHLKGVILFNKSNSFAFPTIRPPGSAIQVTQ